MREAAVPVQSTFIARLARWRVTLGFVLGAIVLWLARPSGASLAIGGAVGILGELIRLWAAGHLEKSREVTVSGPYRWSRHPLYIGSSIMGLGLAIASARLAVFILVAMYLSAMLTAAIRTEEALLHARFGGDYEAYRLGGRDSRRSFSFERALTTNREHRSVIGLAIAMVLLAIRMLLN